jgi:hypothetical protein
VLDRLVEVLPAEVRPAELEVGPLVLRIFGYELLQELERLRGVGIGARLGRLDDEPFARRDLGHQRRGMAEVLEELGAGRGAVGEVQVGHCEVGILGNGASHILTRLMGSQILLEGPALEVVGLRLGRGGAEWNLPGLGSLRGKGGSCDCQRGERQR